MKDIINNLFDYINNDEVDKLSEAINNLMHVPVSGCMEYAEISDIIEILSDIPNNNDIFDCISRLEIFDNNILYIDDDYE